MSRKKLYILLAIACLAGYTWLGMALLHDQTSKENDFGMCIIKEVTGIPCPSCGSTRSVIALLKGDVYASFSWNPMGLIVLLIMLAAPLWILFDVIKRKDTLFNFYSKAELFLQQRMVAIPLILLVAVNWAWNIYKGL